MNMTSAPELSGEFSYVFTKREVLKDMLRDIVYRILYVDAENDIVYWIELDGKTNVPRRVSLHQIETQMRLNALLPVADTYSPILDEGGLSAASIAKRDQAYNVIKGVVSKEPEIYQAKERTKLLKEVEDVTNVRSNNVYRYLGLYWRGGMVKDALVPRFVNCGGHRTAQNGTTIRLGRPKQPGSNGKILTEDDYGKFAAAVKAYRIKNKRSIRNTYDDMIDNLYCIKNGDGTYSSLPADEKPSFDQFRYWYRKNRDVVEEKQGTTDETTYERNYRQLLGNSSLSVLGPGMAVQIDATIGDIYLVSTKDPAKVVGRPVIFMTIDVYSRMIVGLHVCLENASHKMARIGLLNTMNEKVSYCRRYGIDITEEQWPCHFKPVNVIADNGELGVEGATELVSSLGITIVNCPPYRGDLKGIVERLFGWIQVKYFPYRPGYVSKDEGTRGTRDHRKDACLDIISFTKILILGILLHNNGTYLDNYQRTPDQYEADVKAVPVELWNYGMEHRTGTTQAVPLRQYCSLLYTPCTATVTEHGIRCNDLYYASECFKEMKWFDKARISGHFPVQAYYDEMSVNTIYVKVGDDYVPCSLVYDYEVFRDKTPEELEEYSAADKAAKAAFTQTGDTYRTNTMHKIEDIWVECRARKVSAAERKNSLSSGSIAKNREEECEILKGFEEAKRKQAEIGLPGDGPAATVPPEPKTAMDQVQVQTQTDTAAQNPIQQSIDDALRNCGLID